MSSGSVATTNSNQTPTFRLLTHAGTHVYCTAQNVKDCEIWLSALHSGLEITYAGYEDTLTILKKLQQSPEGRIVSITDSEIPVSYPKPPKSLRESDLSALEPLMFTPALVTQPRARYTSPSKTKSQQQGPSSPCGHNIAFMNPYDVDASNVSKTHCVSCGRYPPENTIKSDPGTPLPQYGMEIRVQICKPCCVGQGLLRHIHSLAGLYASDAHERVALMKGRELAVMTIEKVNKESGGFADNSQDKSESEALENIIMTPEMITGIREMVSSSNFSACRRRSSALDKIAFKFESGVIGAAEFLEMLNDYSLEAIASSTSQTETIQMKKEALMVAGDMRAAIKMLHQNALPSSSGNGGIASSKSTEMLSCILEFFLDLCEQGDLSSLAFFWTQICQIHLQMLPATDSESLARVELMEDFLLTVCARHSIHLALELVWSCLADLEESIGISTALPSCNRRRFALMRFVCELESLIFDLDGGWGGGHVSLREMYSPSEHQSKIIKHVIGLLQMHRRFSSHHLSRSVRLDKLNEEATKDDGDLISVADGTDDSDAIEAAKRKFYIAKSAEYFSTQLMFCRRLGDIAEKLRFMEVDERAEALENELESFNASGRLGGDPLNHTCQGNEYINVLRIPKTEGHVFRSKERTPVLLLMEIRRDQNKLIEKEPILDIEVDDGTEGQHCAENELINFDSVETYHDENEDDCVENIVCEDVASPTTPKVSHLKQVLQSPLSAESDTAESVAEVENLVSEKLKIALPDLDLSTLSFKTCESKQIDEEDVQMDEIPIEVSDEFNNVKEAQNEGLNSNFSEVEEEEEILSEKQESASIEIEESSSEGLSGQMNQECESDDLSPMRKVSAFGSLRPSIGSSLHSTLSPDNLAAHGEGRRQVLTTMFTKGQRSNNLIARGVAPAARRAIQAMDRKRAQLLMNAELGEDEDHILDENFNDGDESNVDSKGNSVQVLLEEEECIEAIRLLLVQNNVALGKISPETAAQTLSAPSSSEMGNTHKPKNSQGETDAGDIDTRLAGCGTISNAVLSALELWKQNLVSNAELLDLIQKDLQFNRLSLPGAENETRLKEDSAFWGRFAFGERWAEKKARIQASSVFGSEKGWDLTGVIIKSNDDLRQEAFAMQLIELCSEAFELAGLELWTYPYRILATGRSTGIIEMVRNSMSFDSLKKRPGYEEGGLLGHFKKMSEYAADPNEALKAAKKNFVTSLAAYSLLSYFFVFKDRHNGNLLLDTAGHVIHIDFGFIFGIAPGGSFSLEQSVPFKLTEEMIEVMDGLNSVLFSEFVTLFCCGFLALQAHWETFETIVGITCEGSTFKCFEGKDSNEITLKMKERFCPHLSKEETVSFAMDLIRQACNATGTKQYDFFQYMSQGIAA